MKDRTPVICARCRATGYLGEGAFEALAPALDFKPVPRKRKRHDGWTPERQRGFIEALARTGSVSHAAMAVNMAKEGAYQLRFHPEAGEFVAAWDTALDYGVRVLEDAALDRSINGVPVPIFHNGEQVGERRTFNERMTQFQLQHRRPEKYGNPAGKGTRSYETEQREEYEKTIARDAGRMIDLLLIHYSNRVQMECEARQGGFTDEADFYLRQLTHIEVMIEIGGGARYLIDIALGNADPDRPWVHAENEETWSTQLTDLLRQYRVQAWQRHVDGEEPVNQAGDQNELKALGKRLEEYQAMLDEEEKRRGRG